MAQNGIRQTAKNILAFLHATSALIKIMAIILNKRSNSAPDEISVREEHSRGGQRRIRLVSRPEIMKGVLLCVGRGFSSFRFLIYALFPFVAMCVTTN